MEKDEEEPGKMPHAEGWEEEEDDNHGKDKSERREQEEEAIAKRTRSRLGSRKKFSRD